MLTLIVLQITFFREVIPEKESSYKVSTVSGIVIVSIVLQPSKALLSISETGLPAILEGIIISVSSPTYPQIDTYPSCT